MLYNAYARGGYKVPGVHDKDNKRKVGIIYKPDTWAANTVYYKREDDDYDVVLPETFTGLYLKVKSPGKSGATMPTVTMIAGEETTDGANGLVWEAVNYNLMPPTLTITASTWTASNGVTISGSTFTDGRTYITITAVPAGVTEFTLINHTTRSNSEEEDVTLVFKVDDR